MDSKTALAKEESWEVTNSQRCFFKQFIIETQVEEKAFFPEIVHFQYLSIFYFESIFSYLCKNKPTANRKRRVESPKGSDVDEKSMSRLDELLSDVGDGLDTVDVDSTYRPPKRMKVEKVHVIFLFKKYSLWVRDKILQHAQQIF